MRLGPTILVALMLVVGNASLSAKNAIGQTRLGLHVTQEELNIWKQRAASGPYKSAGDVSTNSPDDWTRILNNANTFVSNPSAERWSGQPAGTCWSSTGEQPSLPNRNWGEKLRDAGFVYLLTGTASYRDVVRTELLAQAATAGTNWNDRVRWSNNTGCATSDSYDHEIAMWLTKLIYGYDYIRSSLSSGDQTTLDNWFRDAGLFWQYIPNHIAEIRFPNRNNDDYVSYNKGYDPAGYDGSSATVTHYGGWIKQGWMEGWSNRTAVHARLMALAGILSNNSTLKTQAKRWVKEAIKYATFSDGTYTDFSRWTSARPGLGWGYSAAVYTMGMIADAFARAGDQELYNFSTTEGKYGTEGEPKSLYKMMKLHLEHVNGGVVRYGTDQAARNGDPNYRIDSTDQLSGEYRNHDTYFAPMNLFYKDSYLKSIYMRTASGAPAYPANPSSAGFCVWCGDQGTLPGVLFMFGQMEGKVSPYPGTSVPPPPTTSPNPIAYWNFDEGAGTVAKDSSATGNSATLVNGATWTTGKSGSAVSLDGLDDFVKITTTNFSTSQGTFAAWVKASFFKSGPQYIFGHTSLPVYGNRIQLYTDDIGGNPDVGLGDTHTSALNIQQLQTNNWYYLTLTWNAGAYAVYVDGIQKTAGSYSGLTSLSSYAHIGGTGYDTDPQSWTGAIDEVKVWNRPLSATEVQNEYNSYQPSPPAAPSALAVQVQP